MARVTEVTEAAVPATNDVLDARMPGIPDLTMGRYANIVHEMAQLEWSWDDLWEHLAQYRYSQEMFDPQNAN
jgi:hypothetical protein